MPSTDVLRIIYSLLPGFLAAWIFYGLTAHPRKDMFERIVQALIFTALVNVIVYPIKLILISIHRHTGFSIDCWTDETQLLWSVVVAIPMGLLFAGWANNNTVHRWVGNRKLNPFKSYANEQEKHECWEWTKRTSFPSEWFSSLNRGRREVILHLEDRRRIIGWPYEWPDQPDSGHFVLQDAAWMLPSNELAPLHCVEVFLVPAKCVAFVEIMRTQEEIEKRVSADDVKNVETVLVALQKEECDGKQGTTTETCGSGQEAPGPSIR